MTTLSAYIDDTGIHAPSYADILASLQASYRSIYGSDVYLGNDSQDGQLLAIFAQAISDCNATAVAVYNSFSPTTARGTGLSSVVKINGLRRLVPSNSTADVAIVGQVGTVITNGIIQDSNNNKWDLPATVTIPLAGTITVTATAQESGAITASADTITQIVTPTLGWQTVTNPAPATPGSPVESDAALRVRQAASTALGSETPLAGIVAAVANIEGVTEIKPYENDTDSTDANGIPSHSISLVIVGGDATEIAEAIVAKKNPGTGTYGTTTETVLNASGIATEINFFRPTDVPIDIHITVKALTGYVSTTTDLIKEALADYVSAIPIGGGLSNSVEFTKLIQAALSTDFELTYNVTALTFRRDSDPFATTDVDIDFNEVPSCVVGDVSVTVT